MRELFLVLFLSGFTLQAQVIFQADNGKFGFTDKKGKEIIAPIYDEINGFYKGEAEVFLGGKVGKIDPTGKVIIPLVYQQIEYFDARNQSYAHLCLVTKNGLKGIWDKNAGKEIIPAQFEYLEQMLVKNLDHCVLVANNDTSGVYDLLTGKVIVPFKYNSIEPSENFFHVFVNGKMGAVNFKGQEIVPPLYYQIQPLHQQFGVKNLLEVRDADNKGGVYNLEGKEIIPVQFQDTEIALVSKSLLRVTSQAQDKAGLFDLTGRQVLPIEYDWIKPVKSRIEVSNAGRKIYLDKEGNEIH